MCRYATHCCTCHLPGRISRSPLPLLHFIFAVFRLTLGVYVGQHVQPLEEEERQKICDVLQAVTFADGASWPAMHTRTWHVRAHRVGRTRQATCTGFALRGGGGVLDQPSQYTGLTFKAHRRPLAPGRKQGLLLWRVILALLQPFINAVALGPKSQTALIALF